MQAIVLSYRGEPLRVFRLDDRGLDVGSAPGCDIVVHDVTVPARAAFVGLDSDGSVEVEVLGEGRRRRLSPGGQVAVGERHGLSLAPPEVGPGLARTQPIATVADDPEGLTLLVGRGADARRARIGAKHLVIGSGADADLVLADPTVSASHCRIEPSSRGTWVRDLGSRNGTWVDGVRTGHCRVAAGSRLRVGRTELVIIARGAGGDARRAGIVAESPQMLAIVESIERIARLPFPVLITGPSGAGKEGIARAIHARGPRHAGPLVAVNAAAIPRDLVESELFGHEKGAFTGAHDVRRGVFEQADGGTLFLDEVGELTLETQARLLRVLETSEVRRLGGEATRRFDTRLVCATHRNLHELVARGSFRPDLFYRLVQLRIEVPPLAERPLDVRALAVHFLDQLRPSVGPRELTAEALDALISYGWPGNARELRNVLVSAATESSGPITETDIRSALRRLGGAAAPVSLSTHGASMLVRKHGSIAAAAKALGVPRTTLRDRLQREAR